MRRTITSGLIVGAAASGSGTIKLNWSDCGDSSTHGHITSLSPTSVTLGTKTSLSGKGKVDETIPGATYKVVAKEGFIPIFSHTGDACKPDTIKLPAGAGEIDMKGFKCPLSPGAAELDLDLTLSSSIPAKLARITIELTAQTSSGDKALCVQIKTSPENLIADGENLMADPAFAAAGPEGPCDILGAANNTCFAAHSTVRALYGKYDGRLYQVTRKDGKSADIGVLKAGGFANIKAHDDFCSKDDCVISLVYDQSPKGNHLGQRHKLVPASRHKIAVGDHVPVYGMWFEPGYGMHVDKTNGVPEGNDPESMYAVMSGKNYNGKCCFDYGNSETTDKDDGCGTMEAIYFGNAHWHGNTGSGSGPWVGADLEQGMYYGGGEQTKVNHQNTPLTHDFVSVGLKGRTDGFTLMGGDATTGTLKTMYDGPRPDAKIAGSCTPKRPSAKGWKGHSYQPMRKEGAIILATGGDQSNGAQGNFYEGFMAYGYASAETDAAVQANIVAVGYKANADVTVV